MEILKIGSKNNDVVLLQSILQKKGYTVDINGVFDEKTENAVIQFQKDNNLSDDGIVGKITINKLMNNNENNFIINSTKYVLPNGNFYSVAQAKLGIILHHTNGWAIVNGTKDTPSMNSFNWWKSRENIHISTAYTIDIKGNIYNHFQDNYWAYHLGLGSSFEYLERHTVAIENVNEGGLTKENDGNFYWWSGDVKLLYNRSQDEPIFIKNTWRGFNYFAPYSKDQFENCLKLVLYLCDKFKIKRNCIGDVEFHPELLNGDIYNGITTHTNYRDYPDRNGKNKWDLSPAWDFNKFKIGLEK